MVCVRTDMRIDRYHVQGVLSYVQLLTTTTTTTTINTTTTNNNINKLHYSFFSSSPLYPSSSHNRLRNPLYPRLHFHLFHARQDNVLSICYYSLEVCDLIYRFHPHAVHGMWQVLFNMWVLHCTELDVCKLFHIPRRKQLYKQAWWTTKGGKVTCGTDGRALIPAQAALFVLAKTPDHWNC